MNIKNIVLTVFTSGLFWGYANAQSIDDAVIFSKDDNAATARIKGMGNVQTALGGDISSVNGNPAGLGFFSRSDINITFDYLHNSNKSNFLGNDSKSTKGNFGVSQAGVVFNFPSRNQLQGYKGWQNLNIGISYNKKQNFSNSLIYNGDNQETSYVNNLTDLMANSESFENDFKYSNIVEKFAVAQDGYFPLAEEFYNKNQVNDILTKGFNSNTAIAFGANYNNTFYIGATLGMSFFKYEKSKVFSEYGMTKLPADVLKDNPNSEYAKPSNPDKYRFLDKSYELIDDYAQNTEGSGVDLKIGMIFKPSFDWNIGLTITTPTWYSITDRTDAFTDIYFFEDETTANHFNKYESDLAQSNEDYNFISPWKFSLGATKFFDRGLLSAEAEYITYNTMKYSDYNYPNYYSSTNDDIKDYLKGAFNLRVGGEYLLTDRVSGRAGFNIIGTPYKDVEETNVNGSVGLGFKLSKSTYLDLTVIHQVNSYSASPYKLSDFWHNSGSFEPVADIKHSRTNALITIGAKF